MNASPRPERKSLAPAPDAAPADELDEVSDATLESLRQAAALEFEDEDMEVVSGPAW